MNRRDLLGYIFAGGCGIGMGYAPFIPGQPVRKHTALMLKSMEIKAELKYRAKLASGEVKNFPHFIKIQYKGLSKESKEGLSKKHDEYKAFSDAELKKLLAETDKEIKEHKEKHPRKTNQVDNKRELHQATKAN